MSKIIIDCSVIIKWFSEEKEEYFEKARQIFFDLANNKIDVLAPELILYELINVLIKSKKLDEKTIKQAIVNLSSLQHFKLFGFEMKLQKETIKNAIKYKLTAYDSSYLAVAKILKIPLFTCDKDLLNTKQKFIKHLSSYC